MERFVAFDIETFCPIEELSQEELLYLIGRKDLLSKDRLYREISTNPYVSYVISFAFFFIESNIAEVYYVCEEEKEEIKDYAINHRVIKVFYKPIVMNSGLLEAERMLLEYFWEKFSTIERPITFHGESFDMEFMRIRTIIHGLKPKSFMDYLRSKYTYNIDLKEFFRFAKNNYSLSFISRRFNLPVDKGDMDGSKVREAFLNKRYKDIAEYNLRDVIITGLLYERVKDYIHWHGDDFPQLKERMLNLLESKNMLEPKEFLKYVLEKDILTSAETSKLINFYLLKQNKASNQRQMDKPKENTVSEKQIGFLRDLAQKVDVDMEEVCDQLSSYTIRQVIQSLEEEEIT